MLRLQTRNTPGATTTRGAFSFNVKLLEVNESQRYYGEHRPR